MMAHKQRSKSTSSIPTEQDVQQEIRNQAKETEEQWRDDLARWKSHRRSVHCNMVREREEHERAELAGGGSARKPDTPAEMQGGEREAGTPASHRAASFHTPQAIGFKLQPRSISLPPRSYIANSPYAPAERAVTPPAIPHSTQARTSQEASLSTSSSSRSSIAHTNRTRTDLKGRTGTGPDIPIGATVVDRISDRPTGRTSTAVANVTGTALSGRTGASLPDLPGRFPADPRSGGTAEGSGAGSAYKAPDLGRPIGRPAREKSPGPSQSLHSMDTKPAAAQVTAASLPGSSQRSGSSRLASVVSPRPFGTQSTKISPVSRAFTMEDSYRRFNGETNLSQNSEIADHQHPFLTPEDEARSQPDSMLVNNEAEPGSAPFHSPSVSSQPSCDSSHSKMASAVPSVSEASFPQTRYEDIRIRLSQRTDSTQDFGFQTSWQSTGILIKSIQQGSPAELCQLQVGDAIVAVDGRRVSEMSCEQWKASLDSALQQGSLVLDVRRNGESGSPERYTNASNEVISCPPLEDVVKSSHTFNSQAITDVDSKDMNGRFHPESMESKESQPLSLKNLKRRSEFFEQPGGSESAISDIRIPSISTSSTRHSWDPQEERKRQEKWQQEQERLLQEKYKRDQQKLEEEWRRAQQDAVRENSGNHAEVMLPSPQSPYHQFKKVDSDSILIQSQKHLEVDTRSLSPLSPASPLSQATPPPSEEPRRLEDSDELEETPPQGAEPCKEELDRKGQGEEFGLQRNCEGVGKQPRPEEEEERMMCQQVTDTCPREQGGNQEQDHWEGDGFAKIHPEISLSDRAKSKSTPELDEVDNPEVKVVAVAGSSSASKPTTPPNQEAQKKKKKNRPLSQVEMDRLQILEEMKKKTQLLTDSSWIRQRTTNIYKEPIHLGGGMRRYESLDNLNTARSWRQSPWPPSPAPSTSSSDRPQSAASNSASPHSYTRSISSTLPSSFSMGSLRQSPWSQPSPTSPTPPTALNEESSPEPEPRPSSQRPSSASTASLTSGEQSLELEPEPKSDCETGSSTATPVTPDSLMDCPSPCDLTTLLQAEEEATDSKND